MQFIVSSCKDLGTNEDEENKKEETKELKTESEETYHKEEANAETKKGRKKVN